MTAETLPPDEALLRRVALRDDAALEALYARHSGRVFAVALQVARHRGLAEEILQEVFLHVWQRARTFDSRKATVPAWLVMLTRSRAIDRVRAERAQQRATDGLGEAAPAHAPPTAAPDELLHQRMQSEAVGKALAAMPIEQRRALTLAFYVGLSQSEIAAQLGEPLGTIKTRLRRGMERLSTLLEREEPPTGT